MTSTDRAHRIAPAAPRSDVVPYVPKRNLVLFPQVLAPVTIGRPRSVAAVGQAVAAQSPLPLAGRRSGCTRSPSCPWRAGSPPAQPLGHSASAKVRSGRGFLRMLRRYAGLPRS